MDFEAAWEDLWRRLGRPVPESLGRQLIEAYCETQRHYHTLQHLGECLALAAELARGAKHPEEIELALWFHDAVYEVRAHDNEFRSAQWAVDALSLAGLDHAACTRIHGLIMATRHAVQPDTPDAATLTDIDLAILGAPPERFAEYESQIREEYARVPPDIYADKRHAVLQGFLEREHIYTTPEARERFEANARRNLAGALAISGPTGKTAARPQA